MATANDFELKEEIKIKYPKKYKVFIHNDDYTTMDFVVDILMNIFHKSYEQAESIMLEVHKKDKGLCGVYNYEIAQTKVMHVKKRAKDSGFPLKASMEEE